MNDLEKPFNNEDIIIKRCRKTEGSIAIEWGKEIEKLLRNNDKDIKRASLMVVGAINNLVKVAKAKNNR